MSKASVRAHAKITAKTAKTPRPARRPQVRYGDKVTALALTRQDLLDLAGILATLREPQEIKVKIPTCRAKCATCGRVICEKPEREVTQRVQITALLDAAALLEEITSKAGIGASLWFSK
jgi:hypothetical protein